MITLHSQRAAESQRRNNPLLERGIGAGLCREIEVKRLEKVVAFSRILDRRLDDLESRDLLTS